MLEALGIPKASAVAGTLGAAIAAFMGKDRTKSERIICFLAGFSAACFVPGFIVAWFLLKPEPSIFGGLGFFFGFAGMALCDALMQAGKNLKEIDWKVIIESWLKR